MATKPVSLASLDVRKNTDTPIKREYFGPDLKPTGIILHIIGAQSQTAVEKTNAILNGERQKDTARLATMKPSRPGAPVDIPFKPVEEDVDLGQRLSACYLVGWDGIEETFTEALGLHLIRSNPHLKAQVDAIAGDLAGFTKASPKTS
jgi:hypothetical protein